MTALKIIYSGFYISAYGLFLIVSIDIDTTYKKTYYFLLIVFLMFLALLIALQIVNLWR